MEIGHTLYTSMNNINGRVVAFGVVEFIKEHINRGSPGSRVQGHLITDSLGFRLQLQI